MDINPWKLVPSKEIVALQWNYSSLNCFPSKIPFHCVQ
uniref:Uncharacterized protein n=1 Tax=Rhizophora mucronata TaxID=61149 RepID=A0A2P2J0M5_RHIMU